MASQDEKTTEKTTEVHTPTEHEIHPGTFRVLVTRPEQSRSDKRLAYIIVALAVILVCALLVRVGFESTLNFLEIQDEIELRIQRQARQKILEDRILQMGESEFWWDSDRRV